MKVLPPLEIEPATSNARGIEGTIGLLGCSSHSFSYEKVGYFCKNEVSPAFSVPRAIKSNWNYNKVEDKAKAMFSLVNTNQPRVRHLSFLWQLLRLDRNYYFKSNIFDHSRRDSIRVNWFFWTHASCHNVFISIHGKLRKNLHEGVPIGRLRDPRFFNLRIKICRQRFHEYRIQSGSIAFRRNLIILRIDIGNNLRDSHEIFRMWSSR